MSDSDSAAWRRWLSYAVFSAFLAGPAGSQLVCDGPPEGFAQGIPPALDGIRRHRQRPDVDQSRHLRRGGELHRRPRGSGPRQRRLRLERPRRRRRLRRRAPQPDLRSLDRCRAAAALRGQLPGLRRFRPPRRRSVRRPGRQLDPAAEPGPGLRRLPPAAGGDPRDRSLALGRPGRSEAPLALPRPGGGRLRLVRPDRRRGPVAATCRPATRRRSSAWSPTAASKAARRAPPGSRARAPSSTPLCSAAGCGFAGARIGDGWAFFGGRERRPDALEQDVDAALRHRHPGFYLWVPAASGNGSDHLRVLSTGSEVFAPARPRTPTATATAT